jgi:hypothetical protein
MGAGGRPMTYTDSDAPEGGNVQTFRNPEAKGLVYKQEPGVGDS